MSLEQSSNTIVELDDEDSDDIEDDLDSADTADYDNLMKISRR